MPSTSKNQSWYRSWFDSPYYHVLYRHRDGDEARRLIDRLIQELQPDPDAHILDLACGRGRHAVLINEHGYKVTGLDLSSSNIDYASKYANDRLRFEQGDMRHPFGTGVYDIVLNLFTSFGYFNSFEENLQSCKMMKQALKPGGRLVIDFMNANNILDRLVKSETCSIDGIDFHIERFATEDRVVKRINFNKDGEDYLFEEKVQLLKLEHFEELFAQTGFQISNVYGDSNLGDFNEKHSERLILFAKSI